MKAPPRLALPLLLIFAVVSITLAGEPTPIRRAGEFYSGENNPALLELGTTVARLLESGQPGSFAESAVGTEAEWNALLPANSGTAKSLLGDDPARTLSYRRKRLLAAVENLLAQARRTGLEPGRVRFSLKSITSPSNGYGIYRLGGSEIRVPHARPIRLVLTGEPVGDPSPKPLRGDYELEIASASQLPAGWRLDDGVRWRSFPAGLADASVLRELRLAGIVAPSRSYEPRTISGADDPALLEFGEHLAELLRTRNADAFLRATTFPIEGVLDLFGRHNPADTPAYQEHQAELAAGLGRTVRSFFDFPTQLGIDFSDARIRVSRVHAERIQFNTFGAIEGLRANPVTITLVVESSRVARSGRTIEGTYVISTPGLTRWHDRWWIDGDRLRWQEFPPDLATGDDRKTLELENYLAEHRTFPVGYATPDISYTRLSDNSPRTLAAARGKIVVLEFWASDCGPCQEPMEKLQHLADEHPDWKDRVEVIAISIDDPLSDATKHLAKKKWTAPANAWAGEGGWKSPTAKAFRINSIPTAYVLDREGKVIKAGHPASMDFAAIVDAQLKK